MPVLTHPLNISVSDLKVVGYSYCGSLHVKLETFLGKKWKQRYVIISMGFLYTYTDMYSKKPETAHPLSACESACETDNGDGFCFHLFETDKKPLLFSCDNAETREIWLEKIHAAILETHPNLSADSGYDGSASCVRRTYLDNNVEEDGYVYVDGNIRDRGAKVSSIQACGQSEKCSPHMHETEPKTVHVSDKELSPYSHTTESDYFSLRPGPHTISFGVSDSISPIKNAQDRTSDGDIIYESPMEPVKKFTREDDHRETKKHVKSVMVGKPEGTFAVYPIEEKKLTLCVVTPKGLKYFHIHEQDEQVSLFKDFLRAPNVFPTLDRLLFHYHSHDLPGDGYSVKLIEKSAV